MTDIRTIRTKEKIKKAFITLLDQVPYEKINVTEIAQEAQINRVTFYTHYSDKEDLIKDIVANFAFVTSRNTKKLLMLNHYDDDPLTNFTIAAFVAFIDLALENRDLLAHLSRTENVIIYTYFEKTLSDEFLKIMSIATPKKLIPKYSFSFDFLLAGFNKVVFGWIINPKETKDEFVLEMKRFAKDLSGVNNFLFRHD